MAMTMLQDLGMQYPNENSKNKVRYGIFQCVCDKEFKAQVAHIVSQQPIRFGSKRLAITLILHFKDKRKAELQPMEAAA